MYIKNLTRFIINFCSMADLILHFDPPHPPRRSINLLLHHNFHHHLEQESQLHHHCLLPSSLEILYFWQRYLIFLIGQALDFFHQD